MYIFRIPILMGWTTIPQRSTKTMFWSWHICTCVWLWSILTCATLNVCDWIEIIVVGCDVWCILDPMVAVCEALRCRRRSMCSQRKTSHWRSMFTRPIFSSKRHLQQSKSRQIHSANPRESSILPNHFPSCSGSCSRVPSLWLLGTSQNHNWWGVWVSACGQILFACEPVGTGATAGQWLDSF